MTVHANVHTVERVEIERHENAGTRWISIRMIHPDPTPATEIAVFAVDSREHVEVVPLEARP